MEPWGEWLRRSRSDPDGVIAQLTANGVSLDAALTTMMLARIYEQLLAIERALQVPGDEWRNE